MPPPRSVAGGDNSRPYDKTPAEVSLFSRQVGGRLGEEGWGDEGRRTGDANLTK